MSTVRRKQLLRRLLSPAVFLMLFCLLSPLSAGVEDPAQSRRTALVRAIEKAAPAVVTINVVDIQSERLGHPLLQDYFGFFDFRFHRPRMRQRAVESLGTGFIIDKDGHIITNYHVLQDADLISSVTLPDGRELEVEFVAADERTDLAVLRAKGKKLPYVKLGDSDPLYIGEWVIAIGNPFGNMMRDSQPSVSVGVVSANHRQVSSSIGEGERLYQDMIQTDAAINPGNSGGPLVNALGQVIGVNTMIFSQSGGIRLGLAIPIHRARRVAEELIEYGRRRNPWIGIHGEAVENMTPYARREFGVEVDAGVLITEILTTSPSYEAGLRLGDVIIAVNDDTVRYPEEIDFINWGLFIGDAMRMEINRQGKSKRLSFLIQELDLR